MTLCVRAIQAHTGPVSYGFTERESVSDGLNRRATRLDTSVESSDSTSNDPNIIVATMPAGGWLGSGADEGRAKLR